MTGKESCRVRKRHRSRDGQPFASGKHSKRRHGKLKQLDGFVYRYKGDVYRGEFANFAWEKQLTLYALEGKKLTTFESVKGAAEHTGIDADTISRSSV